MRAPAPAVPLPLPRIPFVLLVLALLGGGLICLLVVNTTLGATSFRISQLQSDNASLSLQAQTLTGQVATEQSPQRIEQRAYQLGMRTPADANILDLRTHHYSQVPDHAGVPGMTTLSAGRTSAAARRAGRRDAAARHRRIAHAPRVRKAGRTAGTRTGSRR